MPLMSLDGSGIGQIRQAAIIQDSSVARQREASNFSNEFPIYSRTAGYDPSERSVRSL